MNAAAPDHSVINLVLGILQPGKIISPGEFELAFERPLLATNLDHWDLWTLVCFHRHLERQEWVRSIVENHLSGDPTQLGVAGSFGHPDIPQQGDVPNLEGWTYFFHGRGCCLTSKADGTSIDVDFSDVGGADEIDPFFFSHFLTSLKTPEFPEQQLRRNAPLEDAWQIALDTLIERCCITREHRLKLTPLGHEIAERLAPIVERVSTLGNNNSLAFLALHLNDAILGKKYYPFSDALAAKIHASASASIEARAAAFRSQLANHTSNRVVAVEGLAALGEETARATLEPLLLKSPINGVVNTALSVIGQWNGPALHSQIVGVLDSRSRERRALWTRDSQDGLPRGTFTVRLIGLYLKSRPKEGALDRASTLVELLKRVQTASLGEAALLLYLLDTSEGFDAMRQALASEIPGAVHDACAACVLLNTEKTRELLTQTLGARIKESQHAAACALLRVSNSPGAEKEWFTRNDGIAQPLGEEVEFGGKTVQVYSSEDVFHHNMHMFVDASVDRMRKEYGELIREYRDAVLAADAEDKLRIRRDGFWDKVRRALSLCLAA